MKGFRRSEMRRKLYLSVIFGMGLVSISYILLENYTKRQRMSNREIDFRIIVMTYNRAKPLQRLLQSLNEVEYYEDRVHIDVWIDRPVNTPLVDALTYSTAKAFRFNHGTITVHNHTTHQGIYGQWLFNWKVTENTEEIVILLEDDLTLSKYVYKWLKLVHRKYDHLPYVNGYSIQGKSMKFGGEQGLLHGPESEVVFGLPILGCWGFSPNKLNWLHFINWYKAASKDSSFLPLVPGLVPSDWYKAFVKAGKADTMWEMWHIYHANKYKELTVYVNLPNRTGLSINWEEPGLHYKQKAKGWEAPPLLQKWDEKYEHLPERPVELDPNGKVVKPAVHTAP